MSYGRIRDHPANTCKCAGVLQKVVVPTPKKMKIGPKKMGCIFIGYAHNNNTYRFLVYEFKNLDIHKNTITESKNSSFFKHMFSCKSKEKSSSSKRSHKTMNEEIHDHEQGV